MTGSRSALLAIVVVALLDACDRPSARHDDWGATAPTTGARTDFDFLLGREWTVHNRVLNGRLEGATEWTEFDARLTDVRPILGGLGNVDRMLATRGGESFEGSSIRIFDPRTSQWTIYWVDTDNPTLRPQVVGGFTGAGGDFFGSEAYRGDTVRLRFRWEVTSASAARWEQAYWDARANEWETNWTMEFVAD